MRNINLSSLLLLGFLLSACGYVGNFNETRELAEQGMAQAQYNLGVMYSKGEGVAQHTITAHMWLNIALRRAIHTLLN